MRAEARRIQEHVAFEHEIRAAMERQREEMTEDADPGPEEDVEDPDEWWRLLQDRHRLWQRPKFTASRMRRSQKRQIL